MDLRRRNIVGDAANEPSIAIDPCNPRRVVIAWRQFQERGAEVEAGLAYSHDAGHTWVFSPSPTPGVIASDPVLAAGPDGVFYFLSITLLEGLRLFRSFDGGVSWEPPIIVVDDFIDKPWITVDTTDGIGRGNVYVSAAFFRLARSIDGGVTFSDADRILAPAWPTLSVGYGGELYIGGAGNPALVRSTNAQNPDEAPVFDHSVAVDFGGPLSWDGRGGGGVAQVWVGTDHSNTETHGNVYLLAPISSELDSSSDLSFVRSTDRGETWSAPVRVNDDPDGNRAVQWFGLMSVAPNGRIDVVWNDSRNFPVEVSRVHSEAYYSFSTDAGVTWSTNVPVSPPFDAILGVTISGGKLGDYSHMVSDNLGVNVAYAATFNGEQDVYFLRIGPWDCNGNEIPDEDDIADSTSLDCNANDVPDECEYRADFDGDKLTTLRDLAMYQRCFTGDALDITEPCCRLFDITEDNRVDVQDLPAIHRVLSGP